MIITNKVKQQNERKKTRMNEKKKGWVVKWQRALLTPFRDATALEAVRLHPEKTNMTWERLFYRKKRYDLGTSYPYKKGNNMNTVNLLFKLYWWYKSPR